MGAFVRGGLATEAYAAAQAEAAQAAAIAAGFGAGQTAMQMVASRSLGVVYTNTTNKPLFVLAVFVNNATSAACYINKGDGSFTYGYLTINANLGGGLSCAALVPPGGTYIFGGNFVSLAHVIEYR